MGNICESNGTEPAVYNKSKRPISSTINSTLMTQNEKINEIKEFLTLTSQNTESFFDAERAEGRTIAADPSQQSKFITDFTIVRGLGKGAFGQVYMVRDNSKSILLLTKANATP